ncbi:MAG TPA: DUF1501 domain-containing protein [Verrucomicrobiales bacterium]|nr:DUF1501 domain-containing protein [Verrucomicrobiales bacterium]
MNAHLPSCSCGRYAPPALNRREALRRFAGGAGLLALSSLLPARLAANPGRFDVQSRAAQFAPRARRVIMLYMGGGPSQMDLLDPKPVLQKNDGQPIPSSIVQRAIGGPTKLMASPFQFARHGQSGLPVSELLPHLAQVVDDIAVVRSGVTDHIDHGEALLAMHTGRGQAGFPSLGCWITYALGTENQDMPAYVAMCAADPERARNATTAGFLPALYQGTPFNTAGGSPIFNLARPESVSEADQKLMLRLTEALNRRHFAERARLSELDARIQNFELAARMQIEAFKHVDLAMESEATRTMYGLDRDVTRAFGTQCLTARRLLESGVRFVHLVRNDWDHHADIPKNLTRSCAETDQPIAALLTDLRQRGLLDDTLVIWTGEFGRLPVVQGGSGRDHNPFGFSFWLAGGGVRGGMAYGATDEFGYAAVENPVSVHDLHATILHLLGLQDRQVTFEFEGREETLTGAEGGKVVTPLLA